MACLVSLWEIKVTVIWQSINLKQRKLCPVGLTVTLKAVSVLFCFLETGAHDVAPTGLDLTMKTRLT